MDPHKEFIYFSFTTALIKTDWEGRVIGTVTDLCSLGDGYFYVSHEGGGGDLHHTRVVLSRWNGVDPLVEADPF